MDNFANYCLDNGGVIKPLIIPVEYNKGLGLMNPSIFLRDGKKMVILRAVNYTFYHSEKKLFQHPYGPLTYLHPENDIHLRTWNYYLELNDNLEITRINKIDTSKFPEKELWEFVGLEDARLFEWEGKLYTSGVRRDLDKVGTGRMELCQIEINDETVVEKTRFRIPPPKNKDSYCEKNWMPILDRPYHYVKWSNPTEVVKVNEQDGSSETVFLGDHHDIGRDIRGGSQLVPWKDYYIAVTHEVDLFKSETNRKDAVYKHRILLWDKNFNLIKWSDDFSIMGAQVEFCVGLAKEGSNFLMTFGYQDNAAYVMKFPEKVFVDILGLDDKHFNFDWGLISKNNDLNKLLVEYVNDPENALLNFNLANYYFNIGQTSSSVSYYIRAAERTNDKVLMYTCLLRASICFEKQGCRQKSVKGLIQNAISLDPKRPEGYFLLSRFYEREKNYHDGYLIASIGEEVSSKNLDPLCVDVDYPGFYGIKFEKAVCSWWCGLTDESFQLHYELKMNTKMNQIHIDAVDNNIERLFKEKFNDMLDNDKPTKATKDKTLEIYEKYNKKHGQWGWCSNDKSKLLIDYINEICSRVDNPVCVEVGVYGGMSVLPVALELKRNNCGIIHAIDPWTTEEATKGYEGTIHHDWWTDVDIEKYMNIFLEYIDEYELHDHVNVIRDASDNIEEIKNIDFLYIDGQHTDQALRDAKKFGSNVNLNGYVLVDDVYWEVESTGKEYSIEYLQSIGFEFVRKIDDSYVLKRTSIIKNKYFNFSETLKQTSWAVDNFYESPDQIRKFALEQEYEIGGIGKGYIGNRTHEQFLFSGLKERFENIMGKKITKWEEHGMNGRFQYCWSGQPLVYHCDRQQWGGMLYLTPNAPFECGTTLYAHKKTKARTFYDEGWDYSWKDVPGDPHLDKTPFEPVDVLGNVYNRLVIFDASCIHSASEYFGTVKENCRLWQMFFFDT